MFDTTIDQIKALRGDEEIVIVKLGDVTEIGTNGKARVRLYGDDKESNKYYNYIDGYLPEKGDKVALLPQGRTYIILGKVTDEKPEQKWAYKDHNHDDVYLKLEYADKLEDQTTHKTIQLTNNVLKPSDDNSIDIGNAGNTPKMFKNVYAKKFYKDGEELFNDRLQVIVSGTTYSLIATRSGGIITLTPSSDNTWALGTSAAKLKEIWTYLFRGTWKSGQSTERAISWDSNNALVPDSSGAIDLGTASAVFKNLFLTALVGAKWQYSSNATYNLAWSDASNLLPSADNQVTLGASAKMFAAVYAKKFYLDGTELSTTTAALTVKQGSTVRTLTLTMTSAGADLIPSVNNQFKIGSASAKFAEIFATKFTGGLTGDVTGNVTGNLTGNVTGDVSGNLTGNVTGDVTGKYKDGSSYYVNFDSSHNLVPDTTGVLSLGTSSKQFKKIYAQEFYINGTLIDLSGISVNQLKDGTMTLTLSQSGTEAIILPSVSEKFYLGSSNTKFKEIVSALFTGDLSGKLKDGSTYNIGFDSSHNLIPSHTDTLSLGTDTRQYKRVYAKEFYMDGVLIDLTETSTDTLKAVNGSYVRTITMTANSDGGNLAPATSDKYNIGTEQSHFLSINSLRWAYGSRYITWDASSNIYPYSNNTVSLGTSSKQYKNIYGQNIYVNGTAVSSDRRLKEEIEPLDEKHVEFFKNLKPVSYKFKDGTSGRKHAGFIAQEVEEAVEEAGLTNKDMAVVVQDKTAGETDGRYYLRYEEIIAVQTKVIQDLMTKVDNLESRLAKLESLLAK